VFLIPLTEKRPKNVMNNNREKCRFWIALVGFLSEAFRPIFDMTFYFFYSLTKKHLKTYYKRSRKKKTASECVGLGFSECWGVR
jgi:hypothetical protein